jgi:hypothetical protein
MVFVNAGNPVIGEAFGNIYPGKRVTSLLRRCFAKAAA